MQLLRKALSCVNEITARMSSFHALLLGLSLGGLDADLLVILLKGGEILTGLGEFSLLHALSDVPMDEGSLGVHEIELVVNAGEDFGNCGRVGDHADGAHNLGEITTGNDGRGLVVDSALETGRPPSRPRGPSNSSTGALPVSSAESTTSPLPSFPVVISPRLCAPSA